MKAILLDAGAPEACQPVTSTRPLAECPIANRPLRDHQIAAISSAGFVVGQPPAAAELALYQRGDAWLSHGILKRLAVCKAPTVLTGPDNTPMAWIGTGAAAPVSGTVLSHDDRCLLIRYPWDLLCLNEWILDALTVGESHGTVSPAAAIEGCLVLGKGSRILPGVFIEGNVMIGEGCKIGPNCYIRGATSIGDGCHIGQAVEIKNSIVMRKTSIGHLSYCGDSVIGEGVNFGAGTIVSNFRHDGAQHQSMVGGRLIGTGRRKFGTVIGDGVHTGIHTSIYPGRKIWPGLSTRPGEIVQRDLT